MPAGEIQTDANAKRKDRSIFVTGTKKGHMVPVVHRFVKKIFFDNNFWRTQSYRELFGIGIFVFFWYFLRSEDPNLKFQSEYRCGGFTYGKSAMEHADDGLFDNAAVTKWERGKAAEVLWKSGAGHRGINRN